MNQITCPYCEEDIDGKDINVHLAESYGCTLLFDATKLQLMNILLDWDLAISFCITPTEGLIGTRHQVWEGKIGEYGNYLRFDEPTKPAIAMNTLLNCLKLDWGISTTYTQIPSESVVFEEKIETMNLKDGFSLIDINIPYKIYGIPVLTSDWFNRIEQKRELIMEKTTLNIALQHPPSDRISFQTIRNISDWLKKW